MPITAPIPVRVEVYPHRTRLGLRRRYGYRLRTLNGEILFNSEGFASRRHARVMGEGVANGGYVQHGLTVFF